MRPGTLRKQAPLLGTELRCAPAHYLEDYAEGVRDGHTVDAIEGVSKTFGDRETGRGTFL